MDIDVRTPSPIVNSVRRGAIRQAAERGGWVTGRSARHDEYTRGRDRMSVYITDDGQVGKIMYRNDYTPWVTLDGPNRHSTAVALLLTPPGA